MLAATGRPGIVSILMHVAVNLMILRDWMMMRMWRKWMMRQVVIRNYFDNPFTALRVGVVF